MPVKLTLLDLELIPNLDVVDFLITPVFIAIVMGIAFSFRNKHYPPGHPWRKFFLPALTFKIVGAIAISLIYIYYYNGGDTTSYFFHGRVINSAFEESPTKWLNLILSIPTKLDGEYYEYTRQMWFYGKGSTHLVSAISGIISLFGFNSFLTTSILFAGISFTGIWALFRTFAQLYPKLSTPIAMAVLFIPSVALWGSGIFKDTLILFSLGWLTRSMLIMLVFKKYQLNTLIVFILSFAITFAVKIYVIISFLPPVLLWIILERTKTVTNRQTRVLITTISIILSVALFATGLSQVTTLDQRYSIDALAQTSNVTRNWIYYVSKEEGGSAYNLGDFSPTLGGMLTKFPQAVNVTLFRPYLWEAKKVIVFLTSLESLLLLFITIRLLGVVGIKKTFRAILTDSTIQFCFVFSLIFAFSVGISSYNFGALSRYKIPCIPFFLITLILIFYKEARPGQRLFKSFNL